MLQRFQPQRVFMAKKLHLLVLATFVGLLFSACGPTGIQGGDGPSFEVNPSAINFSQVNIGGSAEQTVEITNVGAGTLNLSNITLHDDTGDAFSTGTYEWPNEASLQEDETLALTVVYEPTDTQTHGGSITMTTNDPKLGDDDAVIEIGTLGVSGELFADPGHVDFPQVPVDSSNWKIVELRNIGGGPLSIDDIFISSGEEEFSVSFPTGRSSDGGFPPIDEDAESAPENLDVDDDPILMRVLFEPESEDPAHGEITIQNSDLGSPDFKVTLAGNSGDPCLETSESDGVEFGPAAMNDTTHKTLTLRNCSPSADLDLSNIEITDDGGGVFDLDAESLPGELPGETFVLSPGDITTAVVTFHPTGETAHDGALTVQSTDSVNPDLTIPISGTGVDAQCPIAQATGAVGGAVPSDVVHSAPQEIVELSGAGSTDPDGTDLTYEWSIIARPSGSLAGIQPTATMPNPFFDIDIVGTFLIELTVYDELGLANCDPAIVEIQAAPTGDIHVELTWKTPEIDAAWGEPDGEVDRGTDLDLYYVHPDAEWTDVSGGNVIYYLSTESDWGEHGDVSLDIDDQYGELPENINHSDPADGGSYRVGIHYYNARTFGAADATVRIYFGVTLYDQYERRMNDSDNFWHVGNIEWSDNPTFDFIDDFQSTHPLRSAVDSL